MRQIKLAICVAFGRTLIYVVEIEITYPDIYCTDFRLFFVSVGVVDCFKEIVVGVHCLCYAK